MKIVKVSGIDLLLQVVGYWQAYRGECSFKHPSC